MFWFLLLARQDLREFLFELPECVIPKKLCGRTATSAGAALLMEFSVGLMLSPLRVTPSVQIGPGGSTHCSDLVIQGMV